MISVSGCLGRPATSATVGAVVAPAIRRARFMRSPAIKSRRAMTANLSVVGRRGPADIDQIGPSRLYCTADPRIPSVNVDRLIIAPSCIDEMSSALLDLDYCRRRRLLPPTG
jgi:hypothetical protein